MNRVADFVERWEHWQTDSHQPDGSWSITTLPPQLAEFGLAIHDLAYAELREVIKAMSVATILPGNNSFLTSDTTMLWAWVGQVMVGPPIAGGGWLSDHIELEALFRGSIHASVADFPSADDPRTHHLGGMMCYLRDLAVFVGFPLLEGVLRRRCESFVQDDGIVASGFTVVYGDHSRKPRQYKPGQRCSNLGDLLYLLRDNVAGDDLREDLQMLCDYYYGTRGEHLFDAVFYWRNGALHGSSSTNAGAFVMDLVCLISLEVLAGSYDEQHQMLCQFVSAPDIMELPFPPWHFYPPAISR